MIAIAVVTTGSLMLAPTTATAQAEVDQTTATLAAGDSEGRANALAQQAAELYQADNAQAAALLFAEATEMYRRALGDKHPSTLTSLNNSAFVLLAMGRASEAKPLCIEALNLRRETLGNAHPDTLGTLRNCVSILEALGRDSKAEQNFSEILQLRREVLGSKHADTLSSLNKYAALLETLGRSAEAEPMLAEALQLRKETLGENHPNTINSINNYAHVLEGLGRQAEAAPLYAEALLKYREVLGDTHPSTLISLNNHGAALNGLGRASEAEPLLAEAFRLTQASLGEKHPSTLTALSNYAAVLKALGRNAEAEPLFAKSLQLRQEVLGNKDVDTLASLNNYAGVLDSLGRSNEAESLYRSAMHLYREVLGDKHPDTLTILNNYASVLSDLGHSQEAEPLYAEALRLRREVLGDYHPDTMTSLNNYGWILEALGRIRETEPMFAQALRQYTDTLGAGHPRTLSILSNYAFVLGALGRTDEAEQLYAQALQRRQELLGESHPATLESMNDLAIARMEFPAQSYRAVEPARTLVSGIRSAREIAGFSPGQEAQRGREEKSQSEKFQLFAEAAWLRGPGLRSESRAAGANPLDAAQQAGLREEVFTALQDSLAGAAGKAISASVAQKAAGSFEPLAIEREQLSLAWIETDKKLVETLTDSSDVGIAKRNALRTRLAAIEARMKAIDDTLRRQAPDYFALIRPSALSLAQAQTLLAPDEAALIIVPGPLGTHVMLVTDQGLTWVRSDWANDKIDAAVKRLLWDVGGNVDVDSVDAATWENEGAGAYPYAFDRAFALYQQLIAPVAYGLKSKRHLFISASGSLSSLPFGLLVSEVPAGDSGDPDVLRSAKWFTDAHVLVQIPSLQSLDFLRKYRSARGAAAALPFLGVGDPVLDGQAETRGGRGARTNRTSSNGAFKSAFAGSQTRSGEGIANISGLKTMARLPGTATELTAMWEQFGKPANALHLADQATENFVRTPGNLSASIIAFATHGLLAGEIGGTAEPGLVLTPPSEASKANDGYLSTSEIAALKLNADWVILSACNTAAGDGSEGAPGLSGLARSFFYAGARNLLASHWPVRDDVAARLTVRTIAIARENPGLSRAQSFQQAMREIREDTRADSETDTWAHPSAWAPFSLIGDGAN